MLLIVLAAAAVLLPEKRPGYGAYYGLAKLSGARLDIGPVDWATLTRRPSGNDALVCPAELCPGAKPDQASRTWAMPPADLLARFIEVVLSEPGTRALPEEPNRPHTARFIQYTRLMRFPDTIDIEVFATPDNQSTVAIYSRSLLGRGDFGVNRARVARWLAKLDAAPRPLPVNP